MIFSCDNLQESIRKSNDRLSVTFGKLSSARAPQNHQQHIGSHLPQAIIMLNIFH